jgi:hypothetical protein
MKENKLNQPDVDVVSGSNDVTGLDLGNLDVIVINSDHLDNMSNTGYYNYSSQLDSIVVSPIDTITMSNQILENAGTLNYNWNSPYSVNPAVNITKSGIEMSPEADIKFGGRSLNQTLDQIQERLAILKPNPKLEEKWENLKDLRKQYEELEKDILEKERVMSILKEQ